jgi:hypothetical protein
MLDKLNLMSEDQAITAAGAVKSTNSIALGDANKNRGEPIRLLCQVTEDFTGGTSVIATLQTDEAVDATGDLVTATSVITSATILTAALLAGTKFTIDGFLPEGVEEYIQLLYTVTGTFTAGKITAGLLLDEQDNFQ